MNRLLDSNVCIQHLRGKNPLLLARFRLHAPTDLAVCSPVVGELRHGAYRSKDPVAETAKVDGFLTMFRSLPFDDPAADEYARIRFALEAAGTPISDFDLTIAAVARLHGLILVTHNTKEFARVPGLQLEDWELP